jgi:ankyrin repeat protein
VLLKRGADVDIQGKTKRTALMWAARWGHQNMARILLAAGATLDLVDGSKMTALDLAASKGQVHVEKMIESGIAQKVRDFYQEKVRSNGACFPMCS